MANYVRVASVSMNARPYTNKPAGQSFTDFEIEWLEKNIAQVLPDKPDLIVLPECCDRPDGMPIELLHGYYAERGDKIFRFLSSIAAENKCYICYGTHRFLPDGTGRNSAVMIGRRGETVGIYDKNHIVPSEYDKNKIIPGERETVFECDFGSVGAVICFDLNFSEIREKYKRAENKPSLMLFLSNFGGGLMRNFFAFDLGCYFVSACAYGCAGEIVTPLGTCIGTTSNHYNFVVRDINLDFEVIHLDNNREKIGAAKRKYGNDLRIDDIGYIGVCMLSYEGKGKTVKDIVREFGIVTASEYFEVARKTRADLLENFRNK